MTSSGKEGYFIRNADEMMKVEAQTPRSQVSCVLCLAWFRKLLREHQLEAVTKAAQQDELERRRRLEQQRKQDFPTPALTKYKSGEKTVVL